jgi:hypothetical protein
VARFYEFSMFFTLFSKTIPYQATKIKITWNRFQVRKLSNRMAITLRQVAKLAGVSLTTASRVINHHSGVRPQVRERVWQVIHDLGYQPNPAARSLAAQRSQKET